jgi:hypothetical protein
LGYKPTLRKIFPLAQAFFEGKKPLKPLSGSTAMLQCGKVQKRKMEKCNGLFKEAFPNPPIREAYAAVFFDPHFGQTLPANPLNPQSKQRLAVNITFLYAVSLIPFSIVPALLSQHRFPSDRGECQKNLEVSA